MVLHTLQQSNAQTTTPHKHPTFAEEAQQDLQSSYAERSKPILKEADVLKARHMGLTAKAQALNAGLKKPGKNEEGLSQFYISELLAGKKVKLKNLFGDAQLKDVSVSMQDDLDAHYDELSEALEENISVIVSAKEVYDAARLAEIIGSHQFLCDAKIAAYDQNHIDLKTLKRYVQQHYPAHYKKSFVQRKIS